MTELKVGPAHPSARIQVLDIAMAAPGKCVVCGYSGDGDRQFIDIGFDLDYYGVIYWCTACFTSVANQLSYANPEQVQEVLSENMDLSEKVTRLTNECDSLRHSLSHYISDEHNLSAVGAVLESQKLPSTTLVLTGPELKIVNSVNESGPDDISNDGGDTISIGD